MTKIDIYIIENSHFYIFIGKFYQKKSLLLMLTHKMASLLQLTVSIRTRKAGLSFNTYKITRVHTFSAHLLAREMTIDGFSIRRFLSPRRESASKSVQTYRVHTRCIKNAMYLHTVCRDREIYAATNRFAALL